MLDLSLPVMGFAVIQVTINNEDLWIKHYEDVVSAAAEFYDYADALETAKAEVPNIEWLHPVITKLVAFSSRTGVEYVIDTHTMGE